jgi:hypothetical protein
MKIFVVGSKKDKFLPCITDGIREKFFIDEKHEGENIDFLNPWYCELTGLYYLWKHVKDDIVGLEHYRTYFWKDRRPIDKQEILNRLKDNDIICGGYSYPAWGMNFPFQKFNKHLNGIINIVFDAIGKYDKGLEEYFRNFLNKQSLYPCNMFICKKEIIDKWCNFIFPLLVDIEKVSPIGPGTNTLRREGYITEFLFGAWLEYNGYKVSHCDILKFDKNISRVYCRFSGLNNKIKFGF